jgi:hypothetical protein
MVWILKSELLIKLFYQFAIAEMRAGILYHQAMEPRFGSQSEVFAKEDAQVLTRHSGPPRHSRYMVASFSGPSLPFRVRDSIQATIHVGSLRVSTARITKVSAQSLAVVDGVITPGSQSGRLCAIMS